MTIELSTTRIFLRPGHTDMRKAANGLTSMVQEAMAGDPFNGHVYLFCSKDRKLLKAVWWDKTGFWLCQKRLEKDKFPWPQTSKAAMELNGAELKMLLDGIDFFKAHKTLHYKKVS
jgi:transposase